MLRIGRRQEFKIVSNLVVESALCAHQLSRAELHSSLVVPVILSEQRVGVRLSLRSQRSSARSELGSACPAL